MTALEKQLSEALPAVLEPAASGVSRESRGVLLVAIGGLLISVSPVFVRVASVGPTMAGVYRMLFGGLVLAVVAVGRGERLWRGAATLWVSAAAALFFGLGLTFWHRSIHSIGPGLSTILANLQAFFVAAIAMVSLKERVATRTLVAIPVAIAGLLLLVGVRGGAVGREYWTGVAFGIAAALAYALYLLVFRKLQSGTTSGGQVANVAVVSLVCAAMMAAEAWAQGESFTINDARSWALMVAYGVLCQALAWWLISVGIPRVAAAQASVLLLLQPVGAFAWDVLFFRRATTALEYCGAVLAVAAIYLGGGKK
jgi:drug/metabolite transporter (DMT)-like permease